MQDGQTKYLGGVLHIPNMIKNLVLVVIYDDLIIAHDSDVYVCDVKLPLKQKFEMKDLGEM